MKNSIELKLLNIFNGDFMLSAFYVLTCSAPRRKMVSKLNTLTSSNRRKCVTSLTQFSQLSETKIARYTLFDKLEASESCYFICEAQKSGVVSNGKKSLNFNNAL